MADKAYIVKNKEQEKHLLVKLEKQGCSWDDAENTPPTEWHPNGYTYALFVKDDKKLVWGLSVDVSEVEIMAEDKQDKVKISKEVYDALVEWKRANVIYNGRLYPGDFSELYANKTIRRWWQTEANGIQGNNRLIAIIRWLNGEDVFEVEKPKKWVVRSKGSSKAGRNLYAKLDISHGVKTTMTFWGKDNATRFDTKEEAESWANSHQEVIEVEI